MKKRKRAAVSMFTACVAALYIGTVSLAAEYTGIAAESGLPDVGRQTGMHQVVKQTTVQLLKRHKGDTCREAAEEVWRKMEEEARLAAEEAERIAREQEEAEQTAAQAASVSLDDEALLAALIYCEAGGEPYEGQVAVGAVVMNRVRSGVFPNSVREVIYQSGQFGPAITGKLDRVLANGSTTDSCYQAASEALAGVSPVGGALYFGDGQDFGQRIGGHWFHS